MEFLFECIILISMLNTTSKILKVSIWRENFWEIIPHNLLVQMFGKCTDHSHRSVEFLFQSPVICPLKCLGDALNTGEMNLCFNVSFQVPAIGLCADLRSSRQSFFAQTLVFQFSQRLKDWRLFIRPQTLVFRYSSEIHPAPPENHIKCSQLNWLTSI